MHRSLEYRLGSGIDRCPLDLRQHVRNPLDLAVVAASVLGGCLGFVCWNAQRPRIFLGATGTLALAGALAGLAAQGDTQVLVATGGLVVIVALAVTGWSRYRSAP
jgi:UDP-N-acetylmuramyl pentapeptide phosphotransferase/UDP-N-acetylglucosamine-1-phosphate transferase